MINRKTWIWWLAGAVIFSAIMPAVVTILVFILALVAYFISLRVHPFRSCHTCAGTGRRPGAVFGWSHRQCGSCGGQGRHRRLGTVMFHNGSPVWAESQASKARDTRRARPL